jgi:hypothetical protein
MFFWIASSSRSVKARPSLSDTAISARYTAIAFLWDFGGRVDLPELNVFDRVPNLAADVDEPIPAPAFIPTTAGFDHEVLVHFFCHDAPVISDVRLQPLDDLALLDDAHLKRRASDGVFRWVSAAPRSQVREGSRTAIV